MAEESPFLKRKKKPKIRKRLDELNIENKENLLAAAVKYNIKSDVAPKILVSGKGSIAEEIVKLAEEHKVPLYEDPTLVALLSKLEMDTEIPAQLYGLVAEVLAFVYQLENLAKKKEQIKKRFKNL
ncbi:MAG: EscU/YscU/HrcU family type III secretion system export apparatus switch protein [Candidatus Margulisbacteria bacterium]|nr:EscU/YscU/HrcU family type III secretion system export apparatus switch protein [Candidatus Margulisiibacteriota bacterium]